MNKAVTVMIGATAMLVAIVKIQAGDRTPTSYVFSQISVPGATNTDVWGINDGGDVVGSYVNAGVTHGFLLDGGSYRAEGAPTAPVPPITGGTFTTVDVPGATFTQVTSNNDHGAMAGVYLLDQDPIRHAFLCRFGAFTNIDVPGATASTPRGLGHRGEVVLEAVVGGKTSAYLLKDGIYTDIEAPESFAGGPVTFSYASGINRRGIVVGRYDDEFHGARHNRGFATDGQAYVDLFFPGAVSSAALGINDRDVVVGGYTLNGLRRGWVLERGTYSSLDVPGCQGSPQQGAIACTTPRKINDRGRVVGFFGLGGTDVAGFIATRVHARRKDNDDRE